MQILIANCGGRSTTVATRRFHKLALSIRLPDVLSVTALLCAGSRGSIPDRETSESPVATRDSTALPAETPDFAEAVRCLAEPEPSRCAAPGG